MAVRKLPPSLFSAKPGILPTKGSGQFLHFIALVRQDRNHCAIVCESQPLMSFGSNGLPARCPAWGTEIHSE
jgi:hypothetical protein